MKRIIYTFLALCVCLMTFAQTSLRGRVIDQTTGVGIPGLTITLASQNIHTTTNQDGEFVLTYLQEGDEEILIEGEGYKSSVELVRLVLDKENTLEPISLQPDLAAEAKNEVVLNIAEDEMNDDEGKNQEKSSVSSSSKDVFNTLSSWAWSTARFRNRGYKQSYEQNYIEGISFNTADRGQFNFSAMGGLNDASRYKDVSQAICANDFTFGSMGNSTNYLMGATRYAEGWKVGLGGTNRNYKGVARATYSSGLLANGWAFASQLAYRFSPYTEKKGIIGEGIAYYSFGYFFTAQKQWGDRHKLNLITFGAPTERGQSAAVTQEVYDLTNQYNRTQWGWNNYNPYWGYQNGKMRNSRIVHSYDPTVIAGYTFQIDEHNKLHVGLGFHCSLYSTSAINFYNAPDPRPDYYRNLPSALRDGQINSNGNFISKDANGNNLGNGFTDPMGNYVGASVDEKTYMTLYDNWANRDDATTQINWNNIYSANIANNQLNPDGCAKYIQERRHSDVLESMASVHYYNTSVDHLKMTACLELKESNSHYYKTVDDLLGANQWIDLDPFAERDIAELAENISLTQSQLGVVKMNNVQIENGKVNDAQTIYKSDRFGYDYRHNLMQAKLWYQNEWNWTDISFYYALQAHYTHMQRTSNMLNGRAVYLSMLHPSQTEYYLGQQGYDIIKNGILIKTFSQYQGFAHQFVDPAFKAGFNYKVTGRNQIRLNAIAMTQSPLARNAYISPRVHDRAVAEVYTHDRAENLRDYFAASEKIVGGDLSYEFNYPIVKGRLTGFYSRFWNGMELTSFYDDESRTFVNQSLTNLNRRHCGVEAALAVKLGTYFTLSGATSIGDYRYMDNAKMVMSAENGMALGTSAKGSVYEIADTVMMKGVKVSNGPQLNASLKLSFFHPKMWFADVTLSYFDWNYLSVSPARRMKGYYTGTTYDTNGNTVAVNGWYGSDATNAIHKENGQIVYDENGKPELNYPYSLLDEQESLASKNVLNRFLLDMSVGKLIYLPNRQSISVNLSVSNLTNNVDFKTGGYQQARIARGTKQGVSDETNSVITSNVWKFPSKYYYAWGTNFYLTINYKF